MEKIEYRAIIKFLHLKGNTSTQIKAELDAVYGDSAPSFATVKRWVAEFKRGRTSLADFLFPRLKVWLGGQKFSSNEVIAFVDAYFAKQDAQYYLNGLKGWEHRWKKCLDLKGDYVEK
ncbi:hypothetical protein ALC60_09165 [Trachymyrmex zeteki]|uniref:Mos1 transposase HTH domain-containing protein n=1 Tax=Mycetomoellerius zeteki TaxID=64791 RepID=A0A151WV67_9HYME|nr:hypothetical protein ALC60_09165 [Trachymyrmex zeteki]